MSILFATIGVSGLVVGLSGLFVGIVMIASPSTWKKFSDEANTILFPADKRVTGLRLLVGICIVSISLCMMWSVYMILNSTCANQPL
jgi:hypothetical protein